MCVTGGMEIKVSMPPVFWQPPTQADDLLHRPLRYHTVQLMGTPVYLDHNATTPVDPRVFEAMRPYFCDTYGNAASRSHAFGHAAAKAVDSAREQVATLIGAVPAEIVFTSGATESNNLAIKGAAENYAKKGRHIITQATEHKAVLDPCLKLQSSGFEVTVLGVDSTGRIRLEELAAAIRPDTILVSIMYANNETGTLQPIREIGHICQERGILFHSDATQAVGHLPVNADDDAIDLLSLSAHKFYGPKGVGALYLRRRGKRAVVTSQLDGGGHERGFRSGTLNVPGIVGLGVACHLAHVEMPEELARVQRLRDRLEHGILARNRYVSINGSTDNRLPHTSNMSFAYAEGESIMLAMPEVAVSSGSACTSANLEPSYVLAAMGLNAAHAHSSIRFGVGRFTTEQQIDYVVERITANLTRLREMSPLYEMAMEGIDPDTVQWPRDKHHG
jgi:cysteine desulfurase